MVLVLTASHISALLSLGFSCSSLNRRDWYLLPSHDLSFEVLQQLEDIESTSGLRNKPKHVAEHSKEVRNSISPIGSFKEG